ncbi:hypothetical protein F8388_005576 [Cannabis sativa]|uniref:Uncharacterized protein n=1 Tax=Cannabis sativa TaxID=3483 RepID=A0A7J6H0Q3_CANSA|nr:hypothetical protein F8388_005576 [Cannabis sativa]
MSFNIFFSLNYLHGSEPHHSLNPISIECFIIGIVDGKIIFHRLLLSSAYLCPTNQQIIDVSASGQRSSKQTARRTKASSHFPSLSLVSPSSPFDQGHIAIFSKTQHLKVVYLLLDLFCLYTVGYLIGPGNFCWIHVSLVPVLNVVGEQALDENVKMKLSQFCHVSKDNIITLYDVSNIWHIPLLLSDQKAHEAIFQVLNLQRYAPNEETVVNPELVGRLEKGGLCFTGKDITGRRLPLEKRQRVPSAYNPFIKDEIQRIKSVNPDISHKEAFSAAAKNWAHFPHIHFGPMPDWEEDKCSPAGRRRRSDEGWLEMKTTYERLLKDNTIFHGDPT